VRSDTVHTPPIVRYTPSVFGFPDRLQTKLRYCDTGNVALVAGVGVQVFRWNSTFDPDFTNAGHQPLYRDTYAAIYDQYSVVSAVAKISLMNYSAAVGLIVGATTDDDTTTLTASAQLQEQNHGISAHLTPLAGSKSMWSFTRTWNCMSDLNIDPYSSELYKTAVGSNPTEISTLVLWGTPEDFATTTTMRWKIELIQTVLWTELSTPTGS